MMQQININKQLRELQIELNGIVPVRDRVKVKSEYFDNVSLGKNKEDQDIYDQNIIENKTNPPIYNQFPINTSQIINYYFNLSQYLNMSNNLNNAQSQNLSTNVKTENQPLNQQNSNQTLSQINNGALNQLINIGNMIALLQLHSTYQQYSLLMKNMNTNEKIKKYNTNLIGNKVNREIKDLGKKINNKKFKEFAEKIIENDPECSKLEYAMLWNRLNSLRKTNINWAAISQNDS